MGTFLLPAVLCFVCCCDAAAVRSRCVCALVKGTDNAGYIPGPDVRFVPTWRSKPFKRAARTDHSLIAFCMASVHNFKRIFMAHLGGECMERPPQTLDGGPHSHQCMKNLKRQLYDFKRHCSLCVRAFCASVLTWFSVAGEGETVQTMHPHKTKRKHKNTHHVGPAAPHTGRCQQAARGPHGAAAR